MPCGNTLLGSRPGRLGEGRTAHRCRVRPHSLLTPSAVPWRTPPAPDLGAWGWPVRLSVPGLSSLLSSAPRNLLG